jgi:hypothetical protein
MARKEDLEVRARWRDMGTTSDWTRIHADPDSIAELMVHLETIARDWRRLGTDNVWLRDYELQVRSLERSWIEFTVAGDPSLARRHHC